MSALNAYLFGSFRLERRGQPLGAFPTKKVRALCAYLLLHRDRPQPRQVLAGLFWGDQPEARARHSLSDALWRLKRLVGDDLLLESDEAISLQPHADVWVDVDEFLRLTRPLHRARPASQPLPLDYLRRAAALYRGDLLADLYDDWVLTEREQYRGLYLAALTALVAAAEARGDLADALLHCERLVTLEPLYEDGQRWLIRLYVLAGRNTLALERYRDLRHRLVVELGVEPAPETTRLYETILAEVESGWATAPPAQAASAWPESLRLIGRKRERAELLSRVQGALTGLGGATMILGEAGIGKTRLIQSVIEGAAWRGLRVMKAACRREGEPAYGPLRRALEQDLPARLAASMESLLRPEERQLLARLSPRLVRPEAGEADSPALAESPESVSAVLARALVTLASSTPHLLVIEDLHWSDAGTRRALEILSSHLSEARLCVILSARRGALRQHDEAWQWVEALERRGALTLLELAPLSQGEATHLVTEALGSAPSRPEVLEALYHASGGNPFFLLELIRGWREQGAEATWEDYVARLPRTPGVEAVIRERLARLAPPAHALLEMAAVFGLEIPVEGLRRAAAVGDESFLRLTDELLRARLLREAEGEFEFAHDLTRGVVLSGLSGEHRRQLHCRAAQALEATDPLAVEAIAEHFGACEAWAQAMGYFRRAAKKGTAISAYPLALGFYDRALAALAHMEGDTARLRFEILDEQCQALDNFGDRRAQLACAQALVALARDLGGAVEQARAHIRLARAGFMRGDYAASRASAEAALACAHPTGDPGLEAGALLSLGYSCGGVGDYATARSVWEQAARIFEVRSDRVGLCHAANLLGGLALRQSQFAWAEAEFRRARDLADMLSWVSHRWTIEMNLAHVECAAGRLLSALKRVEAAYAEFERLSMGNGLGASADLLTWINLALGRPEVALDWAYRAEAHLEAAGQRLDSIYARLGVAAAEGALGDFGTARQAAQVALDQASAMNDRNSLATAHQLLASIERAIGDLSAALGHAEAAARLAQEAGLLTIEMEAAAQAAAIGLEQGAVPAARDWAQRGLAARAQIPGPVLNSEGLYLVCAEIYAAAGEDQAAAEALAQAWSDAAQRAAQIPDPELRRAYLESHPRAAIVERVSADHRMRLGRAGGHVSLVYLPRLGRQEDARQPRALIPVIWTVVAPDDPPSPGVHQRRARLRRLTSEAAAQCASPRQGDLAAALGVSERTIRADLAALQVS